MWLVTEYWFRMKGNPRRTWVTFFWPVAKATEAAGEGVQSHPCVLGGYCGADDLLQVPGRKKGNKTKWTAKTLRSGLWATLCTTPDGQEDWPSRRQPAAYQNNASWKLQYGTSADPCTPRHGTRVQRGGISGEQRDGKEEKEGNYFAPLTSTRSTTSGDTGKHLYRNIDIRKFAECGRRGRVRFEDSWECLIFHYDYFHNWAVQSVKKKIFEV